MPAEVKQTAVQIGGNGTAYDKAVKLQAWFRTGGGFQYSEEPSGRGDDSSLNAVLAFLKNKRGYCVQFASGMAVMARSLGIPARVAVGFLPGSKQSDGRYAISLRDAHAWPELYFQGVGWTRFEPTPGSRSGAAPNWSVEDATQPERPPTSVAPSISAAPPIPTQGPTDNGPDAAGQSLSSRITGWFTSIPWQVAVGVVLLLLLTLVPPIAASVRRRLRRGRVGTRIGRVEAAWDELRERLADLGVPWVTSRTPRVFASWLENEYILSGEAKQALTRLVADLELARYAPPDRDSGRSLTDLIADIEVVRGSVAASVTPAQRRRARWLPPSGFAGMSGAPYAPGTRATDVQPDSAVESATTSASQDA
jgi:transglutaminase-like putative cysteine protease